MIQNSKFKIQSYFYCILIITLSFLVYGNGIGGDFVLDDRSVVVGNPMVENVTSLGKVFVSPYYYERPQSGLYRPLVLASYNVNWQFSGSPVFFHFFNIILHGIVGYLVFLTTLKLKDRVTAIVSSLLFIFLPIHVESVTSIVGRTELLAALFFMLALYYSLYKKYKWASIFFLLALFSKETSIAFIPVFIFLELFWNRRSVQDMFKKLFIFAPPVLLYAGLRYIALGPEFFIGNEAYPFFNPIRTAEFWPGIWTAFKVLYLYVEKSILPIYFSSDYSYNQIPIVENLWQSWQALIGILIFAGLIYLAIKRRNDLVGIGVVIFLAPYFIVSNFVLKIGTIMGERLMYMPSLGLVVMVVALIQNSQPEADPPLAEKFKIQNYNSKFKISDFNPVKARGPLGFTGSKLFTFYFLFLTLLAWYGYIIIDRNKDWQTEKALFESAYENAPNSVVNITNKASILFREGEMELALKKVNFALGLEPNNSPALHLAGQIYANTQEPAMAEKMWLKGIEAQPDYLYPYLSLGTLYYKNGSFEAGEMIMLDAYKMHKTPNVITILALNEIALNKNDEAINLIEKHFGKKPKEFELRYILGAAYLKDGSEDTARNLLLELKDPNLSEEEFFELITETEVFEVEI